MAGRAVRVVVADDQTVVREGIAMLLGLLPGLEVVGAAADGEEAVRLVVEKAPDVVLMDLRMPRCDGVEATRRIRRDHPATQVVVLTTFADDDSVFPALRAGARGYLTKDAGSEQILKAIEDVIAGEAGLSPGVQRRLLERLSETSQQASLSGTDPDSTAFPPRTTPPSNASSATGPSAPTHSGTALPSSDPVGRPASRPHRETAPDASGPRSGPVRSGGPSGSSSPSGSGGPGDPVGSGVPRGGERAGGQAELPDGLTAREAEVLALVADGMSNGEIAAKLYVSPATVKTHINNLFAKTGVRDRAQAVRYAYRYGIGLPDRS